MYEKILAELRELKQLTLLSVKKALTTADVANLTGLSKAYIYKLVMKREIPFYKSEGGKITYFNADDVQKWMFAHRYASKAEEEQKEIELISDVFDIDEIPIESLDLSVRAKNVCKAYDFKTAGDIIRNKEKLPYLRNMGRRTLRELNEFIECQTIKK